MHTTQKNKLFELRLCETREYSPRLLEHWLHTLQKHPRPIDFILREKDQKVQLLCSEDLSDHLIGSRLLSSPTDPPLGEARRCPRGYECPCLAHLLHSPAQRPPPAHQALLTI